MVITSVNRSIRQLNAAKPDSETARALIIKLDEKLTIVNQHLMSMTKLMANAAGSTTQSLIKQILTTSAPDVDTCLKLSNELDTILKMYEPVVSKKPATNCSD